MLIDPAKAVQMARLKSGHAEAPAGIAENEDGFLISFEDGVDRVSTMTSIWYWVDKTTGEVMPVGAAIVSKLAPTLRSLDL